MKIKNSFLLLILCSSLATHAAELKKQPRNPEEPATGEIIKSAVKMEAIATPLALFATNPSAIFSPVTAIAYGLGGALGGSILGLIEGTTFATISRAFGTKSKLTIDEVIEPLAVAIGTTSAISAVDTVLNPTVTFELNNPPKNATVTQTEQGQVTITYKDPVTGAKLSTKNAATLKLNSEINGNKQEKTYIIQDRTPYGMYTKAAVWLSLAGYLIYKRHAISAENRKKEKELVSKALAAQPLCA